MNKPTYRSAVESLLYLRICTRPDILYAVSKAAQKSKEPNLEDWENLKRILKGTKKYSINISRNSNIKAFVDTDYAGDTKTRRSTIGFVFTIGDYDKQNLHLQYK